MLEAKKSGHPWDLEISSFCRDQASHWQCRCCGQAALGLLDSLCTNHHFYSNKNLRNQESCVEFSLETWNFRQFSGFVTVYTWFSLYMITCFQYTSNILGLECSILWELADFSKVRPPYGAKLLPSSLNPPRTLGTRGTFGNTFGTWSWSPGRAGATKNWCKMPWNFWNFWKDMQKIGIFVVVSFCFGAKNFGFVAPWGSLASHQGRWFEDGAGWETRIGRASRARSLGISNMPEATKHVERRKHETKKDGPFLDTHTHTCCGDLWIC